MSLLGGILRVVTAPLTIPLNAINSIGGGSKASKASAQSVAAQMATIQDQSTQQIAADQAQIAAVQSQLNAAQASQKNWEYGAIILAVVALVVVVVMRFRKKPKK